MPVAKANGIEIAYETDGNPAHDAVVLICGFAASLAWWDDEFVKQLVGRSCYVIRFDNRDTGYSSRLDGPYSLHDMAADIAGLLDHLGIDRATVVGASMGGMIAQTFAIDFPRRTASLCSIMSAPGWNGNNHIGPEVAALFTRPAPTNREEFIDADAYGVEVTGSKGLPIDWDGIRRRSGADWDRGRPTHGLVRQIGALDGQEDRTDALKGVTAPTLVVHGSVDPLVPVAWGEATARAVPGARLMVIDGMGHDLPPVVWPDVVDAIVDNMRRPPAST